MKFNYWDLGQQSTDAIVQVNLRGDAANVRLFDSSKIDTGIARSAFGVVVLSTAFFAKNWAQYETRRPRHSER